MKFRILTAIFLIIPIIWAANLLAKFLPIGNIVIQARLMLALIFLGIFCYVMENKTRLSPAGFKRFLITEPAITLSFLLMILGWVSFGWIFLIASFLFFVVGAAFESFVLESVWLKKKRVKNKLKYIGITDGLLWVHGIINFGDKKSTNIYDTEKLGYLPLTFAYFIMFLYIFVAYILCAYSIYGLFIYVVPVITNILYALKYDYLALRKRKK